MGNICSSLITPSDTKINMSKPLLTHNNELPQGQNNNLIPKSTCSCHIKSKKRLQPGKRKKPIGNSLKRKNKAVRKKVKKLGKSAKNLMSNSITANQEQEQLDEEDLCCCSAQSLPITEVVSNEEYEEYSDQFIKQGKRKRQRKMSKKAKRTVKKNIVCQRLCCRCKAANCSITEKLSSNQNSKKTKRAKKYKKAGNNTCRNSTDNCLPAEELTVEQDHLNDHRSKQEKGEECCQLGGTN